jgi:hypothetical protein
MEQAEPRSLVREAEAVVRRLQGVSAVRIDPGDNGTIDRVHVLSSAERSPRVIVNDVIAALAAELGIKIEPGRVRVATLRPGQTEPGPAPIPARLKFAGISVSTLRATCEARVQLDHDGLMYEGAASGPNASSHRLELIGTATLRAVETYLRAQGLFLLEGAAIHPLGSHQVATVLIAWLGPEEQLLCGSSVVRDDPREAVVRAVLAAVNRPIGWLGGR